MSFVFRTDALAAAFEPAPPPPPGKALIYIYRIKVPPSLRKAKILIDGAPASKLSDKSYTWVYTDPGSHSIRSEWGMMAGAPSLEIVVHVRPDKTYFLKLVGSIRNAGEGR